MAPALIGEGKRMWEGLDGEARLRLVDSRVFGSGMVMLDFRPAPREA